MFQQGDADNQLVIERLLALIRGSDDAIIAKELDGTITDWNPAAERLFGYLAEEVLGKNISIIAPADRPDEIPFILERLRRGRSIDHFHTVRRHKDGRMVQVSLTISPIHDATGKIVGASKISRDISNLRETQRLHAMLEVNQRLLLELNHRVGNNLAIILSLLRSATKQVPAEYRSGLEEALEKVYALSTDHMERMEREAEAELVR